MHYRFCIKIAEIFSRKYCFKLHICEKGKIVVDKNSLPMVVRFWLRFRFGSYVADCSYYEQEAQLHRH